MACCGGDFGGWSWKVLLVGNIFVGGVWVDRKGERERSVSKS